jgi:hypothetical protein
MNHSSAILLTSFLMLTSCADGDLPELCDNASFVGEWRWKKTEGFTGEVLTPKNTGEERGLAISDSTWREFLNGILILEQQYTFTQDSTSQIYSGIIQLEDSSRIMMRVKNCDLWVVSADVFDTPIAFYVRTN